MSGIIHQKQDPNAIRATGTLEKRSPGDQAVQVLLYVLIALIALLCVLPFIYVIAGSFATEQELTERPFFLIPHEFSLNAYSTSSRTARFSAASRTPSWSPSWVR